MTDEQTFENYRNRLDIRDVLEDAGYTLYKRDGLRYPAYVRLDSNGRRISGDKFLVSPGRNCCFQPPKIKLYSVTSFIWEHPDLFSEYKQGIKESALVHKVCQRLLNIPVEQTKKRIFDPVRDGKPFDLKDYQIQHFHPNDFDSQKPFYAFFKSRGIDFATRCAFHDSFLLASRAGKDGNVYKNLSFPMHISGQPDRCVGFEERGYPHKDGTARKGMAAGSNASEGIWIASPKGTDLKDAKQVYIFESAYDAMSFYQLRMKQDSGLDYQGRRNLKAAVFVSTGGNPSYGQMQGLITHAPNAIFHLAFDNDQAGKQFASNFEEIARNMGPIAPNKVAADMRPFIESLPKPLETTKDLLAIDDEQYDALPKPLRELYLKYDSARDEALEYHYSPFLCPEDKQDAADKMNLAYKEFKTALFERLNVTEGQNLQPVKTIREMPSEGYKDFNDELLDKKQYALTDVIETAFDDDGIDLTVERQEENEETKHHGFKR